LSEKEPLANLKDGILTLSFDLIKSTSETNTKTKKLKITEG
jgi:hypothetical protein